MLLAEFSTRLACGLASMMLLTSTQSVDSSHFRTLMQTTLGLGVLAALCGWGNTDGKLLISSPIFAFVGCVVWSVQRNQLGQVVAVLLVLCTGVTLVETSVVSSRIFGFGTLLIAGDAFTSAWLLGAVMAAMLLGHSYLVAPTMSIDPLRRMVFVIAVSIGLRSLLVGSVLALVGQGLVGGGSTHPPSVFVWSVVAVRLVVGLLGPAILDWMVWRTTKLGATQSATGILYAGVVLTFLGELVGRLVAFPLETRPDSALIHL